MKQRVVRLVSNRAQRSPPPIHWVTETCQWPGRWPSNPLYLSKGVAEAALFCAHRTSTVSSCAFCEQGGHLAAPFLILLRARVARAGDHSCLLAMITPSNASSPFPHSTHHSCPIPPPPLWPSPQTSPPDEQQSGAPVRPTKCQTVWNS
jgi:hypothetical protein